jgi:AcrR family transcriptional regulator
MQARRERALDAALELIGSDGIDRLSMRRLATRAGLSVQTLYNLFGSREDILIGLAHRFAADVESLIAEDAGIDDPIDRLRAMFSQAIARLAAQASTYRPMLLALFRGTARSPERMASVWERLASMGEPLLHEAAERGQLRSGFSARALTAHTLESYAWNLQQWADGFIDHRDLEVRTLHGVVLSLLAVASDDARPRLLRELERWEEAREGAPVR